MRAFLDDLRHALHALRRARGFVVISVATLAIGIGLNATTFTLVNALRFRPFPFERTQELVDLHEENPQELCAGCSVGTSWANYETWKSQARSFFSMAAYLNEGMALAGAEHPVRIRGARVTEGFFGTLGLRMTIGRAFLAGDDARGAGAGVVLGHGLWQRLFGGDRAILGRPLRVNGVTHEVIGVAAPDVNFPEAEAWVIATPPGAIDRTDRSVGVIARLRPGVTAAQANAGIATLTQAIAASDPAAMRNWIARVIPLEDDIRDEGGPPFGILFAAAALVLILACANLANVSLARGIARTQDFAVRAALGAQRSRIVRQLLMEGVVVALVGAVVAIAAAAALVRVLPRFLPAEIPMWIVFAVDARVLGFTVLVAVATGVLFTLAPALRIGRIDLPVMAMSGERQVGGRATNRGLATLVVVQLVLAVVLVSSAGLLFRTWARLSSGDALAFDPRTVLTGRVELAGARYQESAQILAFGTALLERLQTTPGVHGAALEGYRFLGTFVGTAGRLTIEGSSTAVPDAVVPRFAMAVTPSYFALRGIRVLRGRAIGEEDRVGAEGVVVVNQATAEALWPGQDALGKRVRLGAPGEALPWLTVVGVVANSGVARVSRQPTRSIYQSWLQAPSSPSLFVQTEGEAARLAPTVRALVASIDPDQPVTDLATMASVMRDSVTPVTLFSGAAGAMALFALLLASLGTFGLAAHRVEHRRREFGVRMALGATPIRILQGVVGGGLRLGVIGAVVGVAGSLAATKVLRAILFGTNPLDPVVLALTVAILMTVTLLACLVPARRASRVAPGEMLRSE